MIAVSNITFSYKKKKILNGISFSVSKGECVAIVGANGCGKSTLLSILAGSLKPDLGEILYAQQNPLKKHSIFSSFVGYVPQENPLIYELTVKDNLKLWYQGTSAQLKDELQNGLLQLLGVDNFLNVPVYKLSGGMKKRVSIALALINRPPILILDEPSAALDLPCKKDIQNYLSVYLSQGGTILITTHEEAELDLCTSLYVLKNGTLQPQSPTLRGDSLLKSLA